MAYLAPSLAQLREEINTRWPGRDHTSDGWIGDPAHQATVSDHNPNSRGSVDAIDVDEDGVSFAAIFACIKRHPRARYVIYERRLYHRDRFWAPETYTGTNPHTGHFHLSIDQSSAAEQDRRSWGIADAATTDRSSTMYGTKRGDDSPDVQALQYTLKAAGFDCGDADANYGPKVAAAVLKMRKAMGSAVADGDNFTPAAYSQLLTALAKKHAGARGAAGKDGAAGKAGKDGRDGADGVVTLPLGVQITGAITDIVPAAVE